MTTSPVDASTDGRPPLDLDALKVNHSCDAVVTWSDLAGLAVALRDAADLVDQILEECPPENDVYVTLDARPFDPRLQLMVRWSSPLSEALDLAPGSAGA